MRLLRLSRCFFDDHADRALPTPERVRQTARHVWVRADDPHLPALVSDAEYYAESGPGWCPSVAGLRRAARNLLAGIGR